MALARRFNDGSIFSWEVRFSAWLFKQLDPGSHMHFRAAMYRVYMLKLSENEAKTMFDKLGADKPTFSPALWERENPRLNVPPLPQIAPIENQQTARQSKSPERSRKRSRRVRPPDGVEKTVDVVAHKRRLPRRGGSLEASDSSCRVEPIQQEVALSEERRENAEQRDATEEPQEEVGNATLAVSEARNEPQGGEESDNEEQVEDAMRVENDDDDDNRVDASPTQNPLEDNASGDETDEEAESDNEHMNGDEEEKSENDGEEEEEIDLLNELEMQFGPNVDSDGLESESGEEDSKASDVELRLSSPERSPPKSVAYSVRESSAEGAEENVPLDLPQDPTEKDAKKGRRLFVGDLPKEVRERDIERFFKGYGRIRKIRMHSNYCSVDFEDPRDTKDAVRDLNGKSLLGVRVKAGYVYNYSDVERCGSRDSRRESRLHHSSCRHSRSRSPLRSRN